MQHSIIGFYYFTSSQIDRINKFMKYSTPTNLIVILCIFELFDF